jgi:three-Cys-motif partner protein
VSAKEATGLLFGGDWTERKLDVLADYLSAYNTALKNQPFTRVYVDAFAGTGYREKRQRQFNLSSLFEDTQQDESQRFLKGSAKRALEAQPPFDEYIFVESDAGNVRALEKLRQEHKDRAAAITIVQGDANDFVQDYCRTENWRSVRAVLFLDPFATEVAWTTLEAVASTEAIDVWILFPLMAINRLLAHDPKKACWHRLTAIFGTEEWFERFYRSTKHESIFGKSLKVVEKACDFGGISAFYLERLEAIFAGVSQKPRAFRNSRGSPLFQLFFAASNEKGAPIALRIADHLLKSI